MKHLLLPLAAMWLSPLLLLSSPAPSVADTVVVTGANGTPGPGVGLPGGDGESATANADVLDSLRNNATARGGMGGTGGSTPSAGPAGRGGNGGHATATSTSIDPRPNLIFRGSAEATGGEGGFAGQSGTTFSDGDAGNGGNAIATSIVAADLGESRAVATGGAGGRSFRGTPGKAGDAESLASLQWRGGGRFDGRVEAVATGGRGGGALKRTSTQAARLGRIGGHAKARAILSQGMSPLADGTSTIIVTATGGDGGSGIGMGGGKGGTAEASLLSTADTRHTIAWIDQIGGKGGGASVTGSGEIRVGGDGADSHLVNAAVFQTSGSIELRQRATAGLGGGIGDPFQFGQRGNASSVFDHAGPGALLIDLQATGRNALTSSDLQSSSSIDLKLTSVGYLGFRSALPGAASTTARAATDTASAVTIDATASGSTGSTLGPLYGESAGGDVTVSGSLAASDPSLVVVNAVDGQTTAAGVLALRQHVEGFGDIQNEIRKSGSAAALSVTSTVRRRSSNTEVPIPATAVAIAEANNDAGAATATTDATSFTDTRALAVASTVGSGHVVTVNGKAAGGFGTSVPVGAQGNALSESRGNAIDGAVTVTDTALAGLRGSASSRAIGINAGNSSVSVSSLASGALNGGPVTAHATASSLGDAIADAQATQALDTIGVSRALAEASGASGRAQASADRRWTVQANRRVTNVGARATAAGSGAKSALVTAGDGTLVPLASALQVHQAFSVVASEPATSQVLAALAANPNVAGQIGTGPGSSLLALGVIGSASAADAASEITTSSAEALLSVSPTSMPFSPGDQLKLGFLDAEVRGTGFDAVRLRVVENQLVFFDQTFTSVAEVLAFFDDQTLDLATPLPGSPFPLDIQILLEVTTSSAGQGFGTGFLLAFVPEPGLLVLLVIGFSTIFRSHLRS